MATPRSSASAAMACWRVDTQRWGAVRETVLPAAKPLASDAASWPNCRGGQPANGWSAHAIDAAL
ncbi:hypothetical protein [Streptomyces cucumeris]|uniref:hypothetical protein n=1 Tax=Streptomyces cucumeris TaxID=2962890 RepID=UPI003D7474A3